MRSIIIVFIAYDSKPTYVLQHGVSVPWKVTPPESMVRPEAAEGIDQIEMMVSTLF